MRKTDTTENTQKDKRGETEKVITCRYLTQITAMEKRTSFDKNNNRMAFFGKYREIFLDRLLAMSMKTSLQPVCLTINDIQMPTMDSNKSISKESRNKPMSNGKENAEYQTKIQNLRYHR